MSTQLLECKDLLSLMLCNGGYLVCSKFNNKYKCSFFSQLKIMNCELTPQNEAFFIKNDKEINEKNIPIDRIIRYDNYGYDFTIELSQKKTNEKNI